MSNIQYNNIRIVLGAVLLHLSIGSIYAWSIVTKPLVAYLGISLPQVQIGFSLAIFFLGLSAAGLGKYLHRFNAGTVSLFSTLFFISGLFIANYAIVIKSIWLLYLGYGVVGGIGIGMGYTAPITTLILCFPNNRGFATGCAIMGFGFASLIASGIYEYVLNEFGLPYFFMSIGLIYLAVMLIASFLLSAKISGLNIKKSAYHEFSYTKTIFSLPFILIWLIMLTNITCGIGLLSIASPLLQDISHLSVIEAGVIVGILGIANGGGRIMWAGVSDYVKRSFIYVIFFLIQIACFAVLINNSNSLVNIIAIFIIITCYGGAFATLPAFLSDIFHIKSVSIVHGMVLTAWGVAGFLGPYLVAYIKTTYANYNTALQLFMCFDVLALVAAIILTITHKAQTNN
ncbi:MAG: yhjX 1 [Burkholderiales bacterium]|jgi:OFA family oxalate/formate antiporter-like MFS transporter|nr:yhjX 1 [Burkholderiales bacterium]